MMHHMESDEPPAPRSPVTLNWDQDAPVQWFDLIYTEVVVIGKYRLMVTTILTVDEKVAAEAEDFIARCAARNWARNQARKRQSGTGQG